MKLSDALRSVGTHRALSIAQQKAERVGMQWDTGINYVFQACLDNPDLVPTNIGAKTGSEKDVIEKWVQRYKDGYDSRISVRRSNLPSTIADPIIDVIIQGGISHLTHEDLNEIKHAHRLSMSAENILGLLLEEYLANHLHPLGWHCAWGETIRSVDFCSTSGKLLQIKNRSNSENSSSSRVRAGTDISKWYRIDAITGYYIWADLNTKLGADCSEDNFREFVRNALTHNLEALAIESNNPWLSNDE